MKIKNHSGKIITVKPIIKFNGGYGAILCNYCSIIIKDNLTKDEFEGKTDLLFCDKHKGLNNESLH